MILQNKLVALDNTVFNCIYRDPEPEAGHADYRFYKDCESLRDGLIRQEYKVLIPSIVLAESACIFDEAKQNAFFNALSGQGLLVVDFTAATAQILARMLHLQLFQQGSRPQTTKAKLKYDMLILACAIEHGSDCFYTKDTDFSKYDGINISVKIPPELPPSYNKGTLFDEAI